MSTRQSAAKGKQPTVDPSTIASPPSSLILSRGKKSSLVDLPPDYPSALAEAVELFPRLDPKRIFLERELPGVGWVRLTRSGWVAGTALREGEDNVVVWVGEEEPSSEECDSEDEEERAGPARKRVRQSNDDLLVTPQRALEGASGGLKDEQSGDRAGAEGKEALPIDDKPLGLGGRQQILVECWNGAPLPLAKELSVPVNQLRLLCEGYKVNYSDTLGSLDIDDDCSMQFMHTLVDGKPDIYLFPPAPLPFAKVSLTLVPQWGFTALCPVANIVKITTGESTVSWRVSAGPQGLLVDLDSEEQTLTAHLCWEARPTGVSSSSSCAHHTSFFDPSSPSLNSSNGSALPFVLFLLYLQKTVALLSLRPFIGSDMINYFLPSFIRIASRGQHIGFRFLPQAEYEPSARLQVEPKPDVVTRIFLLFRGVDENEAGTWKKADEVDWVEEVGVEEEKAREEGLFRVLE